MLKLLASALYAQKDPTALSIHSLYPVPLTLTQAKD